MDRRIAAETLRHTAGVPARALSHHGGFLAFRRARESARDSDPGAGHRVMTAGRRRPPAAGHDAAAGAPGRPGAGRYRRSRPMTGGTEPDCDPPNRTATRRNGSTPRTWPAPAPPCHAFARWCPAPPTAARTARSQQARWGPRRSRRHRRPGPLRPHQPRRLLHRHRHHRHHRRPVQERPLVGRFVVAPVHETEAGHDHDRRPPHHACEHTGHRINPGTFSRTCRPNTSSGTVLGRSDGARSPDGSGCVPATVQRASGAGLMRGAQRKSSRDPQGPRAVERPRGSPSTAVDEYDRRRRRRRVTPRADVTQRRSRCCRPTYVTPPSTRPSTAIC